MIRSLKFIQKLMLIFLGLLANRRVLADEAEVPLPKTMAAMGDSITAGLFANFKRQNLIYPWVQSILLGEVLIAVPSKSMGALEKRKLSWSTGKDIFQRVSSHASRIEKLNGRGTLNVLDAAVSGEDSSHMARQLATVMNWSQRKFKKSAPDYVTILIGPNDICADSTGAMTSPGVYQQRMREVIGDLLAANASTRVLVSAVPNIENLRTVAKDAKLLGVYPAATCSDAWERAHVCPTLTSLSEPLERAQVAQRVIDYNFALRQVVEEARQVQGDRVRFAADTYEQTFSADDLSIDCFHPNSRGQNMLAAATWKASWWADEWTRRFGRSPLLDGSQDLQDLNEDELWSESNSVETNSFEGED